MASFGCGGGCSEGASQPLIGQSPLIPHRDESGPNRPWSGGEMRAEVGCEVMTEQLH